ncbi:SPFH domain-containing protein [Streptomyces sp. NPDC058623]|uniref:SPFH domain-containing protein n=1 Tax=Streptomyces sp. NPDC058623 TaxID=3346563 RepID=UPI00365F08BB
MYPTRTTSTTGTLHVPPALPPTRHTPATRPPTGAGTPAASHPGDVFTADPASGPASAPAADRTPRSGVVPTAGPAGPAAWTSTPARGHSREAESWATPDRSSEPAPAQLSQPGAGYASRFAEPTQQAGPYAAGRSEEFGAAGPGGRASVPARGHSREAGSASPYAAGAADPLGQVRPEPAPIGARTSAADRVSEYRSGYADPARGAAPEAESAAPYAARATAFADAASAASGSGADDARARGADRSSEYRAGRDGLAGEAIRAGRPEAAPATARSGAEYPGRVPAEGRVQEYAGAQAQLPVPAGASGAEPLTGGALVPEGQTPPPSGGRFAGPAAYPARPHPQDTPPAGVPAARPDPAEPEAPAPRRGRWIEVPTAGRGRSYSAPDRKGSPAEPYPTDGNPPSAPGREGASTPRGDSTSTSTPTRRGLPTTPEPGDATPFSPAPQPTEATPSGQASHHDGLPDRQASGTTVPQHAVIPSAQDLRGAVSTGSASRYDGLLDGQGSGTTVPQHAVIPSAQDLRGAVSTGSASRYDGLLDGQGSGTTVPQHAVIPSAQDLRGADTAGSASRHDGLPDRQASGTSNSAPQHAGIPSAQHPRGADTPGSGSHHHGIPGSPDWSGSDTAGYASRRDAVSTGSDRRGSERGSSISPRGNDTDVAPRHDGVPGAPERGNIRVPVHQPAGLPATPDPRDTGVPVPQHAGVTAAEGPRGSGAGILASPHAGLPATPDPRGSDIDVAAPQHAGLPSAPDPRGDVLVAPVQAEAATAGSGAGLDIPHPAPEAAPGHPRSELWPAEAPADPPRGSGIPGPDPGPDGAVHPTPTPDVAGLVARAVARGMDATREEDDTQDLPHVRPARGAAVTEIPVHLPFRAHPTPTPTPTPTTPAQADPADPAASPARRPGGSTRLPAGRRVPRGDDRLREHRGPVLPGWFALAVGALAMTGCAALLWRAGIVPAALAEAFGVTPRPYRGLRVTHWPPLAFLGIVTLLALGGLGRAKAGHAWVLTLFGRYRGTVRRTGLTWVSPLLLRRRVDVRLRHWRSEPMPAVDSGGLALQVVVQVVWQVKDTARATLAVEDHTDYLAEQVESAMARVLSQLPADAFHEDAPTLRDAEAVGDALTRMLAAETEAVGVEVFSAQPTRIEYAPEVAEAMRRRRVAAIDAKHRDAVLSSVVDAVDDTVHRLTSRGIVELDDYERKALVKDLTVAFYTGRAEQ